jgi:hypothetical protein
MLAARKEENSDESRERDRGEHEAPQMTREVGQDLRLNAKRGQGHQRGDEQNAPRADSRDAPRTSGDFVFTFVGDLERSVYGESQISADADQNCVPIERAWIRPKTKYLAMPSTY